MSEGRDARHESMRRRVRLAVLLFIAVAAVALWLSPLRSHLTREEVRATVEAVRAAWYAPLVLIAMYAVGCVFAVPASLFIVAAGAIWGWLLGGTFAMAGGILGAMASFFAGTMLDANVPLRYGRARRLVDEHLRGASFRSLLILRLLPLFPFAALNYGAGIVRVDTAAFFFSTLIGLIPSNYVFAWSADEIFNGRLTGGAMMLRLLTVAAICVAIVIVPSMAARVVQRRIAQRAAPR